MRFQLKQYDSEAVVFDSASGDTHYLAPLALTLLRLSREGPSRSRDDFKLMLSQRNSEELALVPGVLIDDTLDSLCKAGLIRFE